MRTWALMFSLLAISCGDDSVASPDGPSIDAPRSIDAPAIDAPHIDGAMSDAAPADAAGPTCSDNMMNGNETGIDCGGPDCPSCGTGQGCLTMNDCQSHVCNSSMVCAAPSCIDGVQNGTETDTDCGGPACDAINHQCSTGQNCLVNDDCVTGTCNGSHHCT